MSTSVSAGSYDFGAIEAKWQAYWLEHKTFRTPQPGSPGFDGSDDAIYRIQAWDFLVAGGALYNNLDYSFAVGFEDGTFEPPATTPGMSGAIVSGGELTGGAGSRGYGPWSWANTAADRSRAPSRTNDGDLDMPVSSE